MTRYEIARQIAHIEADLATNPTGRVRALKAAHRKLCALLVATYEACN